MKSSKCRRGIGGPAIPVEDLWARRRLRGLAPVRRGSGRGGELLAKVGELGLRVRQLLPRGLQLAVYLGQVPVLGGHVVREPGQFLLSPGALLLQPLEFGREVVAARGQGRQSLLALGLLLG